MISMKERRKNLIKNAQKIGCDRLIAFTPENLFYMTGFWGEAVGILDSDGATTIVVPELEAGRASNESKDCNIVIAQRGALGVVSGICGLLKNHKKVARTCTDCSDYSTMVSLQEYMGHNIKQSSMPFYDTRMIKDTAELKILKKASKIIDNLFDTCSQRLQEGQKESELQTILMASAIQQDMFDTGYASTLNPLIVAGGPNGALPHAQVTPRRFRQGDLVVVDITLRYKGYVSDATRTFAVGSITPKAQEAYDLVRESQRLGLSVARSGTTCEQVDYTCRDYLTRQEYGSLFIHSTGHGIGLQVHEPPAVSSHSKTVLAKDMAITVEPGVYIPGKFGIRIEDSIIIQDNKRPLIMHKFTKDLVTV